MKIYLASFFDTRARLAPHIRALEERGNKVISRWLIEHKNVAYKTSTEDYLTGCAIIDIQDIDNADALIIDTIDETPRGGRECEFAYAAFGRHIPTFVVGPLRNVFHRLATKHFKDWDECLEFFTQVQRQTNYA